MFVYDSMRVRDDLRKTGDNAFWVKESDYNELAHNLESAKVELDNARDQRDQLREALSVMFEDYADACDEWDHENQEFGRKVIEQARAALKATEEG